MDDRGARLKQLIATGQQQGYVLFDAIDALLPEDCEGGCELDDLLSAIESGGLEVREEPDDGPGVPDLAQDFSATAMTRCACTCVKCPRCLRSLATARSSWPD